MTSPMFGKKSGERPAGGGFEHFLKTFRDKRTVVTMLEDDPKTEWLEFREHFDNRMVMPGARSAGVSYPCAKHEGAERCIGCDYPVDHPEWTDEFLRSDAGKALFGDSLVGAKDQRRKQDPGWGIRDASGKWVMKTITPSDPNKADSEGYVSLYKIGFKFWKHLVGLEEELGSLTNQQFVVLKTGENFNDTAYSALPLGKPAQTTERDVPTNSEIGDILGKKYKEVFDLYVDAGLTNEDGTPTGEAAPDTTGEESQDPAGDEAQAAIAKSAAKGKPSKEEAFGETPAGLDGLEIPEGWDPHLKAREATPTQLKHWLDNDPRGAHDYSSRAPRGVLIGLVEKAQLPF